MRKFIAKKQLDRMFWTIALLLGAVGCVERPVATNEQRPNVLLIVADDMGYADLGAYGGEIPTPNLDALANSGVQFTNFRAAPACSPSRAMLLTGVDAHPAGLGNMKEELAPNQVGKPGYEGELSSRVTTLGEHLQKAGYRTLLSGKWHLGESANTLPSARGFDSTFTLASGGASHYADMRPAYAKSPTAKAKYFADGKKLDSLPSEFEYSSQYYVDWIMSKLKTGEASPFFAVLSFTAPHWPLQAPTDAVEKFIGQYDSGYEATQQARFQRQKSLGVIQPQAKLNELPGVAWASLSKTEKALSAKSMEIYAAMVHEMDRHTGRLIEHLRSTAQLDNTIILFLSDNGAEGHTYEETWPASLFPQIRANIDERHDFSYANMGKPDSYTFYDAQWARAGAPASRWHKGFPTEGGLKVPAFIKFAGHIPARLEHSPLSIKDIAPTILDLLDVQITSAPDREKISGISFLPLLTGEAEKLDRQVVVTELFGKVSVLDYPWKAIRLPAPWKQTDRNDWALYHLQQDNLETKNLANENPEKLQELRERWLSYQQLHQVILPDWVSGY